MTYVAPRLRADDALDVFALQGVPGIVGSLALGVTGQLFEAEGKGLMDGGGFQQLGIQLLGVSITLGWSALWTLVLMLVMKYTVGINVTPEMEERGLDYVQIGEQAYDDTLVTSLDLGDTMLMSKLCDAASRGSVAELQTLLKREVDVNLDAGDYDGRTPMHLAAAGGHLAVVKYARFGIVIGSGWLGGAVSSARLLFDSFHVLAVLSLTAHHDNCALREGTLFKCGKQTPMPWTASKTPRSQTQSTTATVRWRDGFWNRAVPRTIHWRIACACVLRLHSFISVPEFKVCLLVAKVSASALQQQLGDLVPMFSFACCLFVVQGTSATQRFTSLRSWETKSSSGAFWTERVVPLTAKTTSEV